MKNFFENYLANLSNGIGDFGAPAHLITDSGFVDCPVNYEHSSLKSFLHDKEVQATWEVVFDSGEVHTVGSLRKTAYITKLIDFSRR